jgi:hypothetical protein
VANLSRPGSTRPDFRAGAKRRSHRQSFFQSTNPHFLRVNSTTDVRARESRFRNAAGEIPRISAAAGPSISRISPRMYASRWGRSRQVSIPRVQPIFTSSRRTASSAVATSPEPGSLRPSSNSRPKRSKLYPSRSSRLFRKFSRLLLARRESRSEMNSHIGTSRDL